MEILDYVEGRSTATLTVIRRDYDDLHERAYKLLTLLVGGGSAAGAFALERFVSCAPTALWAATGLFALSWLTIAACLVWFGMKSHPVRAGSGGMTLLNYFHKRVEDGALDEPLEVTRRWELSEEQATLDAYLKACKERAKALDAAYLAVCTASPLVPLAVFIICRLNGW